MDRVGPEPRALQPLPARVLRRPAAAHRRRPRARAQPEADRLRRARLGPRRLDPGADPQPAPGPAARVRPHVPLHLARPRGRAARLRPHRRHVPRPHRRASPTADELYENPKHPYTGALLSAVPKGGTNGGRAGASCSRATCPRRSTRPRAARSIRAARRPGSLPARDAVPENCRTEMPPLRAVARDH